MDKSKANYISVVGPRLVEPLFTLLNRLLTEPHPGANEVQTGARENGYSLSACLLLLVLLESMLARARSITKMTLKEQTRRPLEFMKSAYEDCPLLSDIEELFVLRDVIAHNHIWHIEFSEERGSWMTLIQREIDEASGDKKFERVVDTKSGVTKRLKLKIVPTLIDRYDVAVVFSVTLKTLRFIDDREKGQLAVDTLRGAFGDKELLDMGEVEKRLNDCLSQRYAAAGGDGSTPASR